MDDLSGRGGGAVEELTGMGRIVLLHHLLVLRESAAGETDGSGANGVLAAVFACRLHAGDLACLVLDELGYGRCVEDLRIGELLDALGQEHHGIANAAHVHARGEGEAVGDRCGPLEGSHGPESHAHIAEPIGHGARLAVHDAAEGQVAVLIAGKKLAAQGLHLHVEIARGRGGVLSGHIVGVLPARACADDAAVGHCHGAAGNISLLHHRYLGAVLCQARRRDEARRAAADDDHITGLLYFVAGLLASDLLGEVLDIVAGKLDGLGDGGLDGVARNGAAANIGNVDALMLDNGCGNAGAGVVSHADGLAVAYYLAGRDGTIAQSGGYVDPAFVTEGTGDVDAVGGHLGLDGLVV